ncbi:hypothetical protein MCHI_003799 [Candidatus Magnetoovum chiemensis]|nr:hypothetical protein MCHI_003799 [Candidatus Magnetoovum chiemensis]
MTKVKHLINSLAYYLDETFFGDKSNRYFNIICLYSLYLIGIAHWLYFYNKGNLSFNSYDWVKDYMFFQIIQQSMLERVIPYHVSLVFQGTNRFLALPETVLSPQILALPYMTAGNFIVFHTVFLYTVGFLGSLMIKRKYKLSILPFTLIFLIFNFNGYIISHLAVGHTMWNGYFLLPFFFLYVLELIDSNSKPKTWIKLAISLFALMLQGSLHIYIWCLMFLIILAISNGQYAGVVIKTILISILLSFFRLLPAAITFWNRRSGFASGYPSLRELFDGLTLIRDHTHTALGGAFGGSLGWWEYDVYVGLVGLAFLLYFGIAVRFRKDHGLSEYKALDYPMVILAILSLNSIYYFIYNLPIPLINSERVSSRFIIIPIIMLTFISGIRMQQMMCFIREKPLLKLIVACGVIELWLVLATHTRQWRVSVVERSFTDSYNFTTAIYKSNEPLYLYSIYFSLVVSLITIILVLFLLINSKARAKWL